MATEQNIFGDIPFTVGSTTNLYFTLTGRNTYSSFSGSEPWQLAIYIDGTLVSSIGGGLGLEETPILTCFAHSVPTGSHTLRCTWYGTTHITFSGGVVFAQMSFK